MQISRYQVVTAYIDGWASYSVIDTLTGDDMDGHDHYTRLEDARAACAVIREDLEGPDPDNPRSL